MSTVDSQGPTQKSVQDAPGESTAVNPTSASLLGFLYWRTMSGGEIVSAVEMSVGHFWNVTRSQIYRELQALSMAGLVEVGEIGPRRRAPYSITARGREAFLAWLEIDPGPDVMRSPFLLKFFFGALLSEETLRRFVGTVRPRHEEALQYYRNLLPAIVRTDPAPAHVVRLAITYEEGMLRWLDSIPWGKLAAEDLDPEEPQPEASEPQPESDLG
jgi:DNA-binding PadR family transcriptional regulator